MNTENNELNKNTETKTTEKKDKVTSTTTIKGEIKEWAKSAILALIVVVFINIFFFSARVDGESMAPNLSHGDRLIVNKLAYVNKLPDYEDIVVFYSETKGYILIKRVIGLPGDLIEIKDGCVYRNGTLLDESAYLDVETNGLISVTVEENKIFVLGDNRPESADSRYAQIGQIDMSDVKGKVIVRTFPNTTFYK